MDITTASPATIDEQFAELWIEEQRLQARREVHGNSIKRQANFKPIRTRAGTHFDETTDEALAIIEPVLAETTEHFYPGHFGVTTEQVRHSVDAIREIDAKLAANEAQQAPLDAEYRRRGGWTRFFIAQSNDGHIHGSTNCSTCNRGRQATSFGWVTEFSGEDEAGIVALAGEHACTVCFPSAPCVGPVDPRFRTDKQIARDEREAKKAAKLAKKSA